MSASPGRVPPPEAPLSERESARRALVIGYGNTLRGDDGAGPAVARAISARGLDGVDVIEAHQLAPEMAIAISLASKVIFIDATADPAATAVGAFRLAPRPGADPLSAHLSDPASLLWLAESLFGGAPEAWLVTIPGRRFDFTEALSPVAARASAAAAARVESLLAPEP